MSDVEGKKHKREHRDRDDTANKKHRKSKPDHESDPVEVASTTTASASASASTTTTSNTSTIDSVTKAKQTETDNKEISTMWNAKKKQQMLHKSMPQSWEHQLSDRAIENMDLIPSEINTDLATYYNVIHAEEKNSPPLKLRTPALKLRSASCHGAGNVYVKDNKNAVNDPSKYTHLVVADGDFQCIIESIEDDPELKDEDKAILIAQFKKSVIDYTRFNEQQIKYLKRICYLAGQNIMPLREKYVKEISTSNPTVKWSPKAQYDPEIEEEIGTRIFNNVRSWHFDGDSEKHQAADDPKFSIQRAKSKSYRNTNRKGDAAASAASASAPSADPDIPKNLDDVEKQQQQQNADDEKPFLVDDEENTTSRGLSNGEFAKLCRKFKALGYNYVFHKYQRAMSDGSIKQITDDMGIDPETGIPNWKNPNYRYLTQNFVASLLYIPKIVYLKQTKQLFVTWNYEPEHILVQREGKEDDDAEYVDNSAIAFSSNFHAH